MKLLPATGPNRIACSFGSLDTAELACAYLILGQYLTLFMTPLFWLRGVYQIQLMLNFLRIAATIVPAIPSLSVIPLSNTPFLITRICNSISFSLVEPWTALAQLNLLLALAAGRSHRDQLPVHRDKLSSPAIWRRTRCGTAQGFLSVCA